MNYCKYNEKPITKIDPSDILLAGLFLIATMIAGDFIISLIYFLGD